MDPRLFAYFHDICHGLTYCLVSGDTFAYTSDGGLIIIPLELINPVRRTPMGEFSFPLEAKIFVVITLQD